MNKGQLSRIEKAANRCKKFANAATAAAEKATREKMLFTAVVVAEGLTMDTVSEAFGTEFVLDVLGSADVADVIGE